MHRGEDLPEFAAAGCLFIITAVESLSDRVLTILDKRHTREDVVNSMKYVRDAGIAPRPTWVTFTPWTTLEDFLEVLEFIEENDLIDHIDPVQYSIRLLIPPGSWLADRDETLPYRGPLDEAAFTYRWTHPDSHGSIAGCGPTGRTGCRRGRRHSRYVFRIRTCSGATVELAVRCQRIASRHRGCRIVVLLSEPTEVSWTLLTNSPVWLGLVQSRL